MLNNEVRIFFHELEAKIKDYDLSIDTGKIFRAVDYADNAHKGQKRKSGKPYIWHPLSVVEILTDYDMEENVLIAGILHDVVEDTNITIADVEKDFGTEVADLVDGVTKLGLITFDSHLEFQVENFRKMFLSMAKDIRVLIIKLADRVHNMRTLKYLSKEKQTRISLETKEIFAPLAHRLGMYNIKWELEDSCFRFLHPSDYAQIKEAISQKRNEREDYISQITDTIQKELKQVNIKATVTGRPKHFWSIYNKMVTQGLDISELYDLFAVRIIVETIQECYATVGVIHSMFKPIPGRFKDYIAMPKRNNYQSLHTTVVGDNGRPVEIQARTVDMHKISEYGIAAHYKYKEGSTASKTTSVDKKLSWLRELLDWQDGVKNSKDYMDSLKGNLVSQEIYVFTPRGDVFELVTGATPIDFAYQIHTEVGHRCVGAKVNQQIKPLDYELQNGDIVEILTSKSSQPKLHWLTYAKSSGARTKIKQWFKKQKQDEYQEQGKELLVKEIKALLFLPSDLLNTNYMKSVLARYSFKKEGEFFSAMALGDVSVKQVAAYLRDLYEEEHGKPDEDVEEITQKLSKKATGKKDLSIEVAGVDDVLVHLSKCCNPIPGDNIIGYITRGYGVSIHRRDCHNISQEIDIERQVEAKWVASSASSFEVDLTLEAFDRVGLLHDILSQIAELGINILHANVRTNNTGVVMADLTILIQDVNQLSSVMAKIRGMSDIYNIYRKNN
jgi:GTP diphosphokinase / guanosine-3',5'-bis(diphosphate) 3'-diphosphatase